MLVALTSFSRSCSRDSRGCDLLGLGFLVPNPLPDFAEPPIIPAVDLEWLREGERLALWLVEQAPDVHLGAVAEKLAQLPAADQAFVADIDRPPRQLNVRMLLEHLVLSRFAECRVRSGEGEFASAIRCCDVGMLKKFAGSSSPLNGDGALIVSWVVPHVSQVVPNYQKRQHTESQSDAQLCRGGV